MTKKELFKDLSDAVVNCKKDNVVTAAPNCLGTICRRCVHICPLKAIAFKNVSSLRTKELQKNNISGNIFERLIPETY